MRVRVTTYLMPFVDNALHQDWVRFDDLADNEKGSSNAAISQQVE